MRYNLQAKRIAKAVLEELSPYIKVNIGYRRSEVFIVTDTLIRELLSHLPMTIQEAYEGYIDEWLAGRMPTKFGASRVVHLGGGIMDGISSSGYASVIFKEFPLIAHTLDIIGITLREILVKCEDSYESFEKENVDGDLAPEDLKDDYTYNIDIAINEL